MGSALRSSHRRNLRRAAFFLGSTGLFFASACSLNMGPGGGAAGGSGAGTGGVGIDTSNARKDTPFGTKVLIGPPGNQVAVEFKPVEEPTAKPGDIPAYFPPPEDEALSTSTQDARLPTYPGLTWQDTSGSGGSDGGNGGNGGNGGTGSGQPAASSAWALVYGAARECLGASAKTKTGTVGHPVLGDIEPVVPSWSKSKEGKTAWAIFPSPPTNCEQLLAMEEVLLCTADKLSELADAIAPVRWSEAGKRPPAGFPQGDWVIPPQKTEDQFVARDLALHLLANLATTDPRKFKVGGSALTCADLFTKAAADPAFASSNTQVLFGASQNSPPAYFPPQAPLTQENVKNVAASRLLLEAQLLHAADQLALDTVEKNVASVESAARANRAKATDAVDGGKAAWGIYTNAKPPYNTMAHSMRAAGGRLEMGSGSPDRACQGTAALNLLRDGYGADASADYEDETVQTVSQARAMRLVESSGVVFPQAIVDSTPVNTLKEAVSDQLVGTGAIQAGLQPDDATFRSTGAGKTIAETIQQVSDADLRFALTQSNRSFRRITSSAGEAKDLETYKGDFSPDYTSPKVVGAGGISVVGGTACGAAPSSRRAQMLRAEAASACEEYRGLDGILDPDLAYSAPFQSGVALGQSLYRRMVVVRENARTAGLTDKGSAGDFAEVATAQSRAWAGSSRMMLSAPSGTEAGTVTIKLLGVEPEQFGVSDLAALKDRVAVTAGAAWVANCAGGLQAVCPKNFQDQYVVKPSSVVVDKAHTDTAQNRKYGTDGGVVTLTFDTNKLGAATKYNASGVSAEPFYLVQQNNKGTQSIVGAARAVAGKATAVDILSPAKERQREGAGRGETDATNPGDNCGNGTPDVCMKGVLKNGYIAVQNDLTPGADPNDASWKYYINAARQAAEKTDQLGREAIEGLFRIEERREGAGEQLAAICGDYGALGDVEFSAGKVNSPKNAALQACLNEDRKDIVFLSSDPLAGNLDDEQYRKILLEILRCDVGDGSPEFGAITSNPLCKDAKSDDFRKITHGGLELVDFPFEAAAGPKKETCEGLVQVAQTGMNDDALAKILAASDELWTAPNQWLDRVRSLRFEELSPDHWVVTMAGVPIMDSMNGGNNKLWPGCGQACQDSALLLSQTFNTTQFQVGRSLFWETQGALWTMGSIAGEIPGKMFHTYVPVADLGESGWSNATDKMNYGSSVPVFTAYHSGQEDSGGGHLIQQNTPSGPVYFLETTNQTDQNILGPLKDFKHSTWGTQAPSWMQAIESKGNKYKFALAYNKERKPAKFQFEAIGNLKNWLSENIGSSQCVANTDENRDAMVALKSSVLGPICDVSSVPWFQADMARHLKSIADAGNCSTEFHKPSPSEVFLSLPSTQLSTSNAFRLTTEIHLPDSVCNRSIFLLDQEQTDLYTKNNIKSLVEILPNSFACTFNGFDPNSGGLFISPICFDSPVKGIRFPGGSFGDVYHEYKPRLLAPSVCEPSKRMPAFLNTGASGCSPSQDLLRAFALQCLFSGGAFGTPLTAPPPEISSLDALPLLYAWADRQEKALQRQISLLHIESVPSRVLTDFQGGLVGSGAVAGEYGATLLQLQQTLQEIMQGWLAISKNLQLLTSQIRTANLRLNANDIQQAQELQGFALQNLQLTARIVQSSIQNAASGIALVVGIASGSPDVVGGLAGIAESSAAIYYAEQEKKIVEETKKLKQQQAQNSFLQILAELNTSVGSIYADINQALSMTRSATASARSASQRLAELSTRARHEVAKANAFGLFNGDAISNSDYEVVSDANVALPVNTVLRRQAQIANLRHQVSLQEAKRLACIARLSIEQRLGVRLSEIKKPVGPYPPALWADDIGLMGGVDYNVLRNSLPNLPNIDPKNQQLSDDAKDLFNTGVDLLADLSASKQYVGDYIDRLENFTTFYNVQFPSQSGSDSVVLSLANDILPDSTICKKTPPNLLYFSGDLSPRSLLIGNRSVGWTYGPCAPSRCLQVVPGTSFDPVLAGPIEGEGVQQASLLLSIPPPSSAPPESDEPLVGSVWQAVSLNAGNYVLSWWDQSRGKDGAPEPTKPSSYSVLLLRKGDDGVLSPVVSKKFQAYLPSASQSWGARRTLLASLDEAGEYILAFQPSASADTPLPSVAIAAVQLEATNNISPDPTAYIQTDSSREYSTGTACSLKPQDVRNAFEHACPEGSQDPSSCAYVLKKPFSLSLTSNLAPLQAKKAVLEKFASGNINFRHGTLAINFVGTAVHSCQKSDSPSCFNSLYEQFSLSHLANPVPVANAMGKPPSLFYFGSQSLREAKALAAERFLTLPISSSDQSLLSQPGFEHTELRGRPLDGTYSLSIKDSPSLQWNRLEDVQIVLRYSYWAPTNLQPKDAP